MSAKNTDTLPYRYGAYLALSGALVMALGGVIKRVVGADLDAALAQQAMEPYLAHVAQQQVWIIVNLSLWIAGVLLLGAAGTAFAHFCRRRRLLAKVAMLCYWSAVPLAIASFVAWIALIVKTSADSSSEAILSVEIIGWFVSRADWIATVLIVGLGPALISLAGREEWVPTWLGWLSVAAVLAGGLTTVAMFTGALHTYGSIIIPAGLLWTIAAGIVLLRQTGRSGSGGSLEAG